MVFIAFLVYMALSLVMYSQWKDWLNPSDPFYRHTKGAPSYGGMMFFLLILTPGMLLIGGVRRLFGRRPSGQAKQPRAYPLVSHEEILEAQQMSPGLSYDKLGQIISGQRMAGERGRLRAAEQSRLRAHQRNDTPTGGWEVR
jgi:hypothetical protein